MYRRKFAGLGMAFVLVLLALPYSSQQSRAHAQPAAQPAGCWSVMPTPRIDGRIVQINSISASSPTDVWVVGNTDIPGTARPFAMRWNGVEWTVLRTPALTGTFSIASVKALSPDEAWVVGNYTASGMNDKPLIARWDGRAWNVVPNPVTEPGLDYLVHIDGTSPTDLWAVGTNMSGPHATERRGIILHWDGTAWTRQTIQDADTNTDLNRVVVLSANDVWAIGTGLTHWDGRAWTNNLPGEMHLPGTFRSAVVMTSSNIVAVGSNNFPYPVFTRWNGATWTNGTVTLGDLGGFFSAVAALPSGEVWAAGKYNSNALFMRQDGTGWAGIPNPVPALDAEINDMVAVGSELWAVGWRSMSAPAQGIGVGLQEPLVVRYTGTPCPGALPIKPLNPPVPLPGSGGVTFPQTGKTISGTFLNYWLSRGSLPQQGYPISDVIGETSATDGKVYTAQYFERAVFEYHPENRGTPYEVLLAHLGTFRYKQMYPGGAPNQRPNTDRGTVTFPETGKRLGGAFLAYWQSHGGLMQQGFPISDEFTEVSPLDGRPYTVQYFERAVFEWHPENAAPNDVLLSHLGRFRYTEKYEGEAANSPAPRQLAASVAPSTLKAGGNYLVWDDLREPGTGSDVIYAYDAARNAQFPISERMTAPNGLPLATNGLMALWSRHDIDQRYLDGYSLDSGGRPRVDPPQTNSSPDFRRSDIAIAGRTLYYTDNWENHTGLFMLDIRVQVERKLYDIAPLPGSLRASDADGLALWIEERPVGNQSERLLRVYRDDTVRGTQTLNSGLGGYSGYAASYGPSGHNIVYSFYSRITDQTTYLHNLRTGARSVIARGAASGPTIKGERVAWVRWPSGAGEAGGWRIELYNTRNGSVATVLSGFPAMPHNLGLLENGKLAFTADTDLYAPGEELYLLDLDARP